MSGQQRSAPDGHSAEDLRKAMTNPFYVLMLANILGPSYTVWDTVQKIHYIAPGRGTVRAHFQLSEVEIGEAKARTAGGEKYEPVFQVDIVDEAGNLIATVEQTLYIRRTRKTIG